MTAILIPFQSEVCITYKLISHLVIENTIYQPVTNETITEVFELALARDVL